MFAHLSLGLIGELIVKEGSVAVVRLHTRQTTSPQKPWGNQNQRIRLELRSHAQVRTHARTKASTRTYSLLPWHSNKNKIDVQ